MNFERIHQTAARLANERLLRRYGKDTFKIGTEEHEFWLRCYDHAYAKLVLKN